MVDIDTAEAYTDAIVEQYQRTFNRLERDLAGSDELSALVKCAINSYLCSRIQTVMPTFSKWIVFYAWRDGKLVEGHTQLIPYTTSMDATVPSENIIMLVKQHRVPGTQIDRWVAKQENAKIAYLANDPILACRLNALHHLLSHPPPAIPPVLPLIDETENQ